MADAVHGPDDEFDLLGDRRPRGCAAVGILGVGHVRDERVFLRRASNDVGCLPIGMNYSVEVPARQEEGHVTDAQRQRW